MEIRKSRFTNLKRLEKKLIDSVDVVTKDGEIRAYNTGLRDAGMIYTDALKETMQRFFASEEQIKKALYNSGT